ncbi:MAG: protein kinase [Clostridia bacterium]|nr:protein kinase [Clostridia bacterium]
MLYANGYALCPLCFSLVPPGSRGCTHCQSISNKTKYSSVLNEETILAGRYSVGKVLGKGGFGVTYLCYDLVMNKKVAIKEFFPDSIACRTTEGRTVSATDHTKTEEFKSYAVKFYEEAKLVSRFNGNPNVISVYEFFYENDTAYFVMEALEGVDLKQYVRNKGGKIDVGEALFVADKMLDALMVVHSAGVLHRDISPDNIYICKNGDIKLIDFGAARQVVGISDDDAAMGLSVIIKQTFAPIEQYQRKGTQGPWTDIYALGATFYYVITGRPIDCAMSRIDEPDLDMTGIPLPLAEVLNKMLAVKHVDRFQSVFEVKSAINVLNFELTPISIHNFCHMCGGEIPFGENICPQCFAQGTNPEPVVPVPAPEPRKKGFLNKWVILASGLGLALVIVIASIALVLGGSEEDATVVSTDGEDVVAVGGETTQGENGGGEILSLLEKRVAAYVEGIKSEMETDTEEGSVELEARGTAIVFRITVKDFSMVDEAVADLFNEFESSGNFLRKEFAENCPEATSLICEIYDPQGNPVDSRELKL